MKALYFLSLAMLCQGLPLNSAPENVKVTTSLSPNETDSYLVVTWDKVESADAADPILGYKVKIWKVLKFKKVVYVSNENGQFVETEIEEIPALDSHKDPPTYSYRQIVVPANTTTITYDEMERGVIYEVAVLTYTKNNLDGTPARKMRIELEADKKA